jgi:putative hemolysin
MNRCITLYAVTIVVVVNLLGCSSSEITQFRAQNGTNLDSKKHKLAGMPDPSAVYCKRLGYNLKVITDDEGGQYGVCIFPENSECEAWAFYRGKCGQPWSYCTQCGYELKDLGPREGWVKGVVCIDKTTQEEIGNVFDLFVSDFLK